jgi:ABC-2 type transport system permease protein
MTTTNGQTHVSSFAGGCAKGAYLTATRYSLNELARNRFAMGLLVVFVPLWYFMLGALIDNTPIAFKYAGTGALVEVNSHNLTLLTAGLNTITLIVGFLLFAQTRASAAFDRRLVLCGYQQVTLMLAKLTAMVVVSALVALYAALALLVFWRPPSLPLVWLGFFGAALIYGALGLFIGAVLTSEIAGFFLIIMVSLFDTFFQNPLDNPLANKPILRYFPSYGPTQISVGGGFTHAVTGYGLWNTVVWFVALALLGMICFWLRTRAWNAGRHAYAVSHSGVVAA